MPYAASQTVNTIILQVKNHFEGNEKFRQRTLFRSDNAYIDAINEAMDEIYADCGYQLDEFSIDTVVGTNLYPMDGSENNFPDEIDEVLRVDYDDVPLSYRFMFPEQIIEPTDDDENGTPTGWYEKWDNGKRYLGLNAKPDSIVELKVYATRIPAVMTATSGVPAILRDFYCLLKDIVIRKFYEKLEDFSAAAAWDKLNVIRGKMRLANVIKKRQGKRVHQIRVYGAKDILG